MKNLVVFFSRAGENYFGGSMRYIEVGNTEIVCRKIMELIAADIFKIEMEIPYSSEYMVCIEQANKDLRDGIRPKLVKMPDNINMYDTIILAYPNYWGTIPMAVVTFLEAFDFTGKIIIPLCTNEGSGMGESENDIKKYAKGASLMQGLSITGSQVDKSKIAVENWLKRNGII